MDDRIERLEKVIKELGTSLGNINKSLKNIVKMHHGDMRFFFGLVVSILDEIGERDKLKDFIKKANVYADKYEEKFKEIDNEIKTLKRWFELDDKDNQERSI